MGSHILNNLEQDYADKIRFNFSVFPASAAMSKTEQNQTSDVVVEPYNTMFALRSLIDGSNMDVTIDNASLYRICTNLLNVKQPSFGDINYLISQAMSSSTASMRFPGIQNNSDIRKLCMNLIPFPRLHFISQGQAPLFGRAVSKYNKINEAEIMTQLLDPKSYMSDINPQHGRILTGSVLFRGEQVSGCEVDSQIKKLTDKCSA